ncbi:MAG: DUF4469 domain-containing protein [Treponema sp.]|jgi:hypothetical protein|nr:DUF4469 domain-containing protein [Treponema sp.]
MALINAIPEILHRIRVKLYPNYLLNVEGAYLARTINEACLSIEEICAALKTRGGFTGNYDDLVGYVKRFLDEAAYQLCDGFAVNTGYFSIHPNVGGTFDKVTEGHDTEKHPVTFRFRSRAPLRALTEHIAVEVEGVANAGGYIDEVTDITTESVNDALTPGGIFSIAGRKIKIAGDDPEIGVYFVSAEDATHRVKVEGHLGGNTASKVLGVLPALSAGAWKAEIRTQFSGSGSGGLKKPRVIESAAILTVPEQTS